MAKQETQTKYHRRRNGVLFTILAVILIAASVVAACTVFFRVETVTVEGTARYTTEEILSVANVEMGANMILTPGEQIAQRIYEALPYVDEVDVQKQFPTTINLKITETQAAMVLQGTASAWLLDAKGKLLEPVSDGTDVSGLIQVTGVELLEPQQGQQAQTTPENQSRLDGLVGLTQALDRAGILASVTSIDVSSSTEIVMVYENRITARMLNNVDFDRKMQVLESIVATLGETDRGSINMRANDRAIWSPESYIGSTGARGKPANFFKKMKKKSDFSIDLPGKGRYNKGNLKIHLP